MQLYWPNSIFRVYIKPAPKKIGLTKRIGWHMFRHTFGTILNANGENPKVIQELLRHATLKVTMNLGFRFVGVDIVPEFFSIRIVRLLFKKLFVLDRCFVFHPNGVVESGQT